MATTEDIKMAVDTRRWDTTTSSTTRSISLDTRDLIPEPYWSTVSFTARPCLLRL
jgi:hypothetical protein